MAVHAPAAALPTPGAARHDDTPEHWKTGVPTVAQREASPPRVNPYHYIHNPGSDELLPPLPPQLARLASGEANSDDEGDSDTSEDDSDDDEYELASQGYGRSQEGFGTRSSRPGSRAASRPGSRAAGRSTSLGAAGAQPTAAAQELQDFAHEDDTVPRLAAATSPGAGQMQERGPRGIMKKMSAVFRRNELADGPPGVPAQAKGLAVGLPANSHQTPLMQRPPPSPPLSDAGDEGYAESVAITESTMDLPPQPAAGIDNAADARDGGRNPASLKPVTEASEPRALLGVQSGAQTRMPPSSPTFMVSDPDGQVRGSENDSPFMASPIHPQPRSTSLDRQVIPPFLGVHGEPRRLSNGSTSSRTGALAMVRSGRLAPQRDVSPVPHAMRSTSPGRDQAIRSGSPLKMSQDQPVYQQQQPRTPTAGQSPPVSTTSLRPPRIERRNTNPTASTSPLAGNPLTHSVSNSSHVPAQPAGQNDDFDLPADILAQTEMIRLERLERRQKKLSLYGAPAGAGDGARGGADNAGAAGATTERRATVRKPEAEEHTKVLVGNLVAEGHRNYVLMYNMLTGIRVAVSRCQAKIKRPITDEDYLARHKYSFDMLGNELTPSAKYDFKFKDYAPWVFRELREEHFHLDPADYLLSLTAKYILSEIGSPGKSGSFFYYSRDYRFIIKTISHAEHEFLCSILKDYHEHVKSNPHTLLSRFYGLHRVKMPRGRKIHFVIMNNLFPPHRDIHETYDLKGSSYGREYPEEKAKVNPRAVLKDKNWVNRGRTFELGPEKRALLTEQLRRDMDFLRRMRIMDYSLLVGIHNMERGNRDNLRETTLAVFHPDTKKTAVHRKPSSVKAQAEANNIRRAVARSDPKRMLDAGVTLPATGPEDRRNFIFYQDEGGYRATDEQNQPLDIVYYLGVIDICTPYNMSKRVEHAWKSITENPVTISCVDPDPYGARFFDFMQSIMRGADPALRPLGLEAPPIDVQQPVGSQGPPQENPRVTSGQHSPDNSTVVMDIPSDGRQPVTMERIPPARNQVPVLNPVAGEVSGAVITSYNDEGWHHTNQSTAIVIDRGDGLPPSMARVPVPGSANTTSSPPRATMNGQAPRVPEKHAGRLAESSNQRPYDRSAIVGHLKAD